LQDYLISRYKNFGRDKAEWPTSVQMDYVNLSLITRRKRIYTVKAIKDDIQFTKQGNIQHILKQNQLIALNEILQYEADKKVVLIEGAPGVGKTTLATKICTNWANREMLKEYVLVLYFPLREPLVRVAESSKELLDYFRDNYNKEDVEYIEEMQGKDVLIILDGWDELRPSCRGEDMFFPKLIKGDILPSCSIIITSRSGSTDIIKDQASHPRQIEILGFTKEQIHNYIMAYFTQEDTVDTGEKLLKDLENYPNVANACYIAINLTIVCYVYCVCDYNLPPTLTKVYEAFVLHAILRYFKKLQIIADSNMPQLDKINELHDLDNPTKVILKNLGQLALNGISTNDLCFSKKELFEMCAPDESFVPFDGYGLLKALRVSKNYHTETVYHFLHLTIQEWLAAYCLAQFSDDEFITWLAQEYRDSKYDLVIQFFCGINQFKSASLRVMVPEMELNFSLYSWIFEGQWEKGCEKIALRMGSVFQLSQPELRQTLQPYDSMVLMFMLSNANTLWKLVCSDVELNSQVLSNMCEHFVSSPNLLQELTMQRVLLVLPNDATILGRITSSQLKLTVLALTQSDLDDAAISNFCAALRQHKMLNSFDVSQNNLTASGALSLSSLFPYLFVLKHFDVSHNNIGVDGCNYIIAMVNTTKEHQLQTLKLSVLPEYHSKLSAIDNKTVKLMLFN